LILIQFEFSTTPSDPLDAADDLVLTRETIFNIAAKYDIIATFAPKVFMDYGKSGILPLFIANSS